MSLKASNLLKLIKNTEYTFLGREDADIYEVQLLSTTSDPASASCNTGILYLADILEISNYTDYPVCILFLPKPYLPDHYRRIQQLITQDYKRNVTISKLHSALSCNADLPTLVEICHHVMQNPVWFLDKNLQIISFSVPGKRKILFPDALSRRLENLDDTPIIFNANENFPYRHIIAPLTENSLNNGYILVFEIDNDFSDMIDIDYAIQISSLISKYVSSDTLIYRSSPTEQFILDILQKQLSPVTIKQQIQNLHFQESEQYYALIIDQGSTTSSIYIKNELKKLLNQDVYELSHYYIVILGCKASTILSEADFPDLLKFLKEHNLYAGLSNGFFELSTLPQAYSQSKIAISLRKRFSTSTYLARYEDLMLIHLLDIANENGISVLSYCHPSTLLLYEYDKAHSTELLETLGAYVYNYCNLQQTADALFIHRNTAYHRINTIKELVNLDFDNPRLLMKLWISTTVFTYLKILDGVKIFGPLT